MKLAVSLHAANDRERSALLPVNRRFPLSELMDACREYVDASGRRMTFEWALIQGENDSAEVRRVLCVCIFLWDARGSNNSSSVAATVAQ